jgi:hypothetical protein
MSNFEQRENTGAIFVNDRKTEDTHPDSTGTALIGGVEYWVNCWRREAKSGKRYLALSFKPKDEAAAQSKKPAGGGARPQDFNDEIPF